MPRVTHVEHARKSPGTCGKCGSDIKVGESYCWWKFRFGGKRVRCGKAECRPRPSDLTQSAFLATLYDIQEMSIDTSSVEAVESSRDDISSALEDLKSECEEHLENMPDNLREASASGEMLQERIDNLDSAISDLDSVTIEEPEREEGESDDDYEQRREEAMENAADEIREALSNIG